MEFLDTIVNEVNLISELETFIENNRSKELESKYRPMYVHEIEESLKLPFSEYCAFGKTYKDEIMVHM